MHIRQSAHRILVVGAMVSAVLCLSACQNNKVPPLPTPSSTPSPSSPSSGSPSPSGAPSSPPSSPSSSPGSSGSSSPSSSPGASLPSSGLPDLSGRSGQQGQKGKKGPRGSQSQSGSEGRSGTDVAEAGKPGGQSGEQSGSDSESGDPAGSQRAGQTAAGDELQRAGEQIAKAGSGEIDPLIPETNADPSEDGDVFADGTSGINNDSDDWSEPSANGLPSDDSSQTANSGGSVGDMGEPAEGGGVAGNLPPELADEVRAAQEALAKAGEALQEAGVAVANAETDEELAAAEALLGDARIAVIVAAQGVETVEDDLSEMPDFGGPEGDIFQDTNAALQEANIALVIATRSILIARTGSAEFPGGTGVPGEAEIDGEIAALEDELDESLVIFDGEIGGAREAAVAKSTPPGTGGGGGRGIEGPEQAPVPISEQGDLMEMPATEDKPEQQQVATADMPDLNQGDIPDAQGDDIVATQLREAAMAESDPELQAKLWEEYKRYKEGL